MDKNNKIHLDTTIAEMNQLSENHIGKIIIWGAGICADNFINKYGYTGRVNYFVDIAPSKDGTEFLGKPVYRIEHLLQDNNESSIIIIATMRFKNVLERLEKFSFKGEIFSAFHMTYPLGQGAYIGLLENIQQLKSLLADTKSKNIADAILYKRQHLDIDYTDIFEEHQYFVKEIIKKDNNAVFIDGGAFNNETIDQFIQFQNGIFKKIYSFEMDILNYNKINQDKYDQRVQILNYGLWDKETEIHYNAETTSSSMNEQGDLIAKCTYIDHICKEDKVTFIKMDIEGAEIKALYGAKNTIKCYKPQLAICVYHKPDDIWQIPFLLKEWVPDYQFYLRHHGADFTETVLYAVCKENN